MALATCPTFKKEKHETQILSHSRKSRQHPRSLLQQLQEESQHNGHAPARRQDSACHWHRTGRDMGYLPPKRPANEEGAQPCWTEVRFYYSRSICRQTLLERQLQFQRTEGASIRPGLHPADVRHRAGIGLRHDQPLAWTRWL